MGRLLFVLSLGALAWWGYAAWFADEAEPENPAMEAQLRLENQPAAPVAASERDPKPRATGTMPSGTGPTGTGPVPTQVDGEVGPPEPGVQRPLGVRVPSFAQAVEAAAAGDPDRALQLLGDTNAFLHTSEGRAAGDKVLQLAASQPDEQALPLLTGLIERSMRGPITRTDTDAQQFVDRAYGALLKPVKRHVFDPTNLTRARSYKVQPGDALSVIARKFSRDHGLKLESGTLALVNRITNPNSIRIGQVLKAPMDPFLTVLEKKSFLMAVYLGPTIVRLYWVGHGEDDITPETEFLVSDKVEKPDWYHPDGRVIPYGKPENVLGDYFVKFSHPSYTGFGAHGTNEADSIGTMQSMGCIRMRDADIEEYFRVIPRGSMVIVRAGG